MIEECSRIYSQDEVLTILAASIDALTFAGSERAVAIASDCLKAYQPLVEKKRAKHDRINTYD